jgi:hypothetical protein
LLAHHRRWLLVKVIAKLALYMDTCLFSCWFRSSIIRLENKV